MQIEGRPGKLVRVYIGSADHWQRQSLADAIVQCARQEGMAGATVVAGIEGYGANSRIHRAAILDLSTDLPIVIEIVDTPEQIDRFLPHLDEMVVEGLIIVQDCRIVKYAHGASP
jgi:hypothetical protein